MDEYLGSLSLLLFCIFFSGFFSSSEIALFSMSKITLNRIKDTGQIFSKNIQYLLSKPRDLLVTIVMGNEIVNGGISIILASIVHEVVFKDLGTLSKLILSTSVSTFLVILFGEMIPKSVGMRNAHVVSVIVSFPIKFFYRFFTPARVVFIAVMDRIIKLFGGDPANVGDMVREEEFRRLVDESYDYGELDEEEAILIHRVFDFNDKTAESIAKPIKEVFSINYDKPSDELYCQVKASGFSRIPVYKEEPHNIVGTLHKKSCLKLKRDLGKKKVKELGAYLHRPLYIFPKWKLDRVLRFMRLNQTHMVFTVNEYGNVLGIVTLHDVLKQMFGEMGD